MGRIAHAARLSLACVATLLLAHGARAMDEVPFVTTPDNVTLEMLRLAEVGPSDYVIDLGSGDGRIVILAARRFGASGLGVDIVPDLVKRSNESAKAAGVADRVEFRVQDLHETDLARATVITLYLLPEVNLELRPKLLALAPGTRVVSHDWDMEDWKPDRSIKVAAPGKTIGLEKSSVLHLWIVPARIDGLWCGTDAARGVELRLDQRFQRFSATVVRRSATRTLEGRLRGSKAEAGPAEDGFILAVDGPRARVERAGGSYAPLREASFVKAQAAGCS